MPIEAPISHYKKSNLKIYIAVCLALAAWCLYDVYFNKDFKEKYTDDDGNPESWMVINQTAPPFLLGAAAFFGAYLYIENKKKLIADENELIINGKKTIPYESIQKIDKTYFDSKGFFIFTYKNESGREVPYKLDSRKYDNLSAVLDLLVAKIS